MTTINPNELKPAREWLNYLPEPIKSEAVEACEKWPLHPNLHCKFVDCISYAIFWDVAGDYDKWREISDQLKSGEILPVSPEAEQQKLNEETENKNPVKVWESLKESVEEMAFKLHTFEKQLNELNDRCPKPMPEPKPLKLPVTIEEVWDEEDKMRERKSWLIEDQWAVENEFNGTDLIQEFRTEKTAKKALAFLTLLKIAEAQNEVVERGEMVFTGRKAVDEIMPILINPSFGQIYFHSEQGLKDCIAANQQLWKDYLEIDN